MKKAWVAAWILTAVFAGNAWAAQGFSADVTMRAGGHDMKGKMYFSPQKIRIEIGPSVMITRLDRKLTWIVMAAQGMYMEQSMDPKAAVTAEKEIPGEISRESIGTETVNGHAAEKFKIAYKPASGGEPQSVYQWIAKDIAMPVRVAAVDDSWSMDYANVVKGDQPDALFEVPAGVQKLQVPSLADIGAQQE